jgi:hypothetical protein
VSHWAVRPPSLPSGGGRRWAWHRQAHGDGGGTSPELLIVDPILTGALLVLAGWVVDPAFVAAQWHVLAR